MYCTSGISSSYIKKYQNDGKDEVQNKLYEYFNTTQDELIQEAKTQGLFDRGIVGKCFY